MTGSRRIFGVIDIGSWIYRRGLRHSERRSDGYPFSIGGKVLYLLYLVGICEIPDLTLFWYETSQAHTLIP